MSEVTGLLRESKTRPGVNEMVRALFLVLNMKGEEGVADSRFDAG